MALRKYTQADEDALRAEISQPPAAADEAMALPADIRAAAEAIEASPLFRHHFTAVHPLGSLHPAAAEFARCALSVMAEAQDHPGRIVTR